VGRWRRPHVVPAISPRHEELAIEKGEGRRHSNRPASACFQVDPESRSEMQKSQTKQRAIEKCSAGGARGWGTDQPPRLNTGAE